ncbi:HNH endonuclease [Dokdonella sp. MW10]|uniref:HNH endonuclease n=1 Tax=Dokdonella sp. MW10 TaxID=2992926 RepID=UPI003F7EA349
MNLNKPSDLLTLAVGEVVTKRNLFDLIKLSKVDGSSCWEGEEWMIRNTPQQGINWIGELPLCRAVLIKTKKGSYDNDGWENDGKGVYRYSLKARLGEISYTEKANRVLLDQPEHGYPIMLFNEIAGDWVHEGEFGVVKVADEYVVLRRMAEVPRSALTEEDRLLGEETLDADDSYAIDLLLTSKSIAKTECIQLIKARVGQGVFRARVSVIEKFCRITGINDDRFLNASHIKPWSKCENVERLDGNNGLLLTPNIDRLFDRGYITFDDDGRLHVSTQLPIGILKLCGLDGAIGSKPLSSQQQRYMAYHRDVVFKA